MSNIFVTGGTGFVGKHLIKRLINEGHYVKILVRKNSDISGLDSKRIKLIIGDIVDLSSFVSEINGIDIIYHLAGVVTDWAPAKLFKLVHIQGTKNILEAAIKAKVKLFIHMSTLDVLQKKRIKKNIYIIREDAPYNKSRSPYIRTKISAEKIIRFYCEKEGINFVIFRPVWIYGPGDKTLFPEIAFQLKKGNMIFIGNPDNLIQLIYIDNLVNYLILVMQDRNVWGHAITLCDEKKITIKELCDRIADGLCIERVKRKLPYSVAYLVAVISEFIGHIIQSKRRPLLTRTAVEMLGTSVEVDISRTKSLLKNIPKVPQKDGVSITIDWLKKRP